MAAFRSAAVGAHSLGEFFEKSGPALERYDAARQNLRSDYSRVARSERNNLNRDLARARALDKKEKGMRNVRAFLEADERRERERAAQVRRLQQLLDEAAAAVGRTFRGSFHEKLEGEMAALRKQGSSPEETRQARERNVAAIEKGLPRASADARQRKRYAESWVAWFLRHKSEPPVAKKEALPDETEHIVLKPARPDPLPKEEPPAKKAEPPSKQDIDLACENNECNLEQYRRFLARLPRSCRGSPLPDVLIKHCFPDFVHLDLSSGRRREIMNFIWFSGDNFFDRMRGLAYFEDVCYRFRPALELGDQMIGPDNAFTTDQKIRIRQALDNIRRCR